MFLTNMITMRVHAGRDCLYSNIEKMIRMQSFYASHEVIIERILWQRDAATIRALLMLDLT